MTIVERIATGTGFAIFVAAASIVWVPFLYFLTPITVARTFVVWQSYLPTSLLLTAIVFALSNAATRKRNLCITIGFFVFYSFAFSMRPFGLLFFEYGIPSTTLVCALLFVTRRSTMIYAAWVLIFSVLGTFWNELTGHAAAVYVSVHYEDVSNHVAIFRNLFEGMNYHFSVFGPSLLLAAITVFKGNWCEREKIKQSVT